MKVATHRPGKDKPEYHEVSYHACYHCPNCGHKGLWEDQSTDDYYGGTPYYCASCQGLGRRVDDFRDPDCFWEVAIMAWCVARPEEQGSGP